MEISRAVGFVSLPQSAKNLEFQNELTGLWFGYRYAIL
jgi:hypothetical protein